MLSEKWRYSQHEHDQPRSHRLNPGQHVDSMTCSMYRQRVANGKELPAAAESTDDLVSQAEQAIRTLEKISKKLRVRNVARQSVSGLNIEKIQTDIQALAGATVKDEEYNRFSRDLHHGEIICECGAGRWSFNCQKAFSALRYLQRSGAGNRELAAAERNLHSSLYELYRLGRETALLHEKALTRAVGIVEQALDIMYASDFTKNLVREELAKMQRKLKEKDEEETDNESGRGFLAGTVIARPFGRARRPRST